MSLAGTVLASASRALKTYGAKGTLAHSVAGPYDPATGGTSVVTSYRNVNALLDASSLAGLGYKFGQDLVQAGDLKATITGTAEVGDVLTLAAGTFTVKAVQPSYVGDVVVTSDLLVRR